MKSGKHYNIIRSTTSLALHIIRPYIRPGCTAVDATCGNGNDTVFLAKAIVEAFANESSESAVSENPVTEKLASEKEISEASVSEAEITKTTISENTCGELIAFDIQKAAIEETERRLESAGFQVHWETERLGFNADQKKAEINADKEKAIADVSGSRLVGLRHRNLQPENMRSVDMYCTFPRIRLICDSHENISSHVSGADVVVFNLGYLPGKDRSITTRTDSSLRGIKEALLVLRKDGVICVTMYSGHPEGTKEKAAILEYAKTLNPREYHVAYISMPNQPSDPPEILLITRKL